MDLAEEPAQAQTTYEYGAVGSADAGALGDHLLGRQAHPRVGIAACHVEETRDHDVAVEPDYAVLRRAHIEVQRIAHREDAIVVGEVPTWAQDSGPPV